jgi:hypothetical protein
VAPAVCLLASPVYLPASRVYLSALYPALPLDPAPEDDSAAPAAQFEASVPASLVAQVAWVADWAAHLAAASVACSVAAPGDEWVPLPVAYSHARAAQVEA